jgi:hypothetical protein
MKAKIRRKRKTFKAMDETIEMIEQIPNQTILNVVLSQEKDPDRRKTLFDFMKQYMTFPNPHCLEVVDAPEKR